MNKKIIILIVFVIGILSITGGVLLLNKNNSKTKNDNETEEKKEEKENKPEQTEIQESDYVNFKDEISYNEYKLSNGDIVLVLKNNSKEDVYLNAEIQFLDKEEKEVEKVNQDITYFEKGKEAALYYKADEIKYDHYKIEIGTSKIYDKKSYIDSLEVTSTKDDTKEEVEVNVKNNSNDSINNIYLSVLFYKDNKVVDYQGFSINNLESKNTSILNVLYPYTKDKQYTPIDFNDVKVYINYAYN